MAVETRIALDRITGKGQVPNPAWTHTTHHVNEPNPALPWYHGTRIVCRDCGASFTGRKERYDDIRPARVLSCGHEDGNGYRVWTRDHVVGDQTRYVLAVQHIHANVNHVAYTAAMWEAREADTTPARDRAPVSALDWHAPLVTGASRYYGTGTPVTWVEGQKVDYVVPLDRPKRMSGKAMGNRCRAAACNAEKGTVTTSAALAILDRMGHVLDPQEYDALVERIDAAAEVQLARTATKELPAIRATMGAMVWTLEHLLGLGVITSREVPALTH